MEVITSEQNQWIKRIRLLQRRKEREESGLFVAEGLRFCEEALEKEANIQVLLISERIINHPPIKKLLTKFSGEPIIVADSILEKNLITVNPQGLAAIVQKPVFDKAKVLEGNLIVIIDGIKDPGNLGTILRTALAANVSGVFCLKGTVDLYNDKTLRSTMGAIFNLPVFPENKSKRYLQEIIEKGFSLVVADPRGKHNYDRFQYPQKTALVLGSESRGPVQIKETEFKVRIPLNSQSESLNVAVAGGILIYEIKRQQALAPGFKEN